jgi:hypothetical protein
VSTRTAASRPTILLAAMAAIALSLMYMIIPSIAAAFTAGDNGHPTGGPYSDLNGGTATFTFQQNAQLTCDDNVAGSFTFHIDYSNANTPAGATLVVYLSPNQGAINGNAGGNAAAYIAAVESNYVVLDNEVSNLSGSGTIDVVLPVTTPFTLVTGGVLGVFASEDPSVDGFQSWTSKTNSLNCTEEQQSIPASVEQSIPASVEQSVAASVSASVPASVPASAEGSVKAGTGTPAASTSNTALFGDGSNPLPTIAFSLILLASLGALAYANVKTVRSRI